MESDLEKMRQRIVAFCEARDWAQFHNPKDLAISLTLEAAEVLEHFQWKTPEEIESHIVEHKDDVADEMIDVLYWVLLMSHYLKIDLPEAFDRKMTENENKYAVEKAKGKHTKYDKL